MMAKRTMMVVLGMAVLASWLGGSPVAAALIDIEYAPTAVIESDPVQITVTEDGGATGAWVRICNRYNVWDLRTDAATMSNMGNGTFMISVQTGSAYNLGEGDYASWVLLSGGDYGSGIWFYPGVSGYPSPTPQFAVVPEPATVGLLMVGGLALLKRRI